MASIVAIENLHRDIEENNVQGIIEFLSMVPEGHSRDYNYLYIEAAGDNKPDIVQALFYFDLDLNYRNEHALRVACINNSIESVKVIVNCGRFRASRYNHDMLIEAFNNKQYDITKLIFNNISVHQKMKNNHQHHYSKIKQYLLSEKIKEF
jgi:hypothetical protein